MRKYFLNSLYLRVVWSQSVKASLKLHLNSTSKSVDDQNQGWGKLQAQVAWLVKNDFSPTNSIYIQGGRKRGGKRARTINRDYIWYQKPTIFYSRPLQKKLSTIKNIYILLDGSVAIQKGISRKAQSLRWNSV